MDKSYFITDRTEMIGLPPRLTRDEIWNCALQYKTGTNDPLGKIPQYENNHKWTKLEFFFFFVKTHIGRLS